jgi:GH25 family lysozyme M1 (1,4-beta-N-acetylmuramidase)
MVDFIQGIDISSHQGTGIDFQLIREDGFRFCICKCTEGGDFEDPKWVYNMTKIKELNDSRGDAPLFFPGAYHFARPDNRQGRSGGETEGRWFSEVLNRTAEQVGFSLDSDFLEPALDFEKYSESDYKDNIPWIEGFLHVLKEETGRSGMIYTGRNVWRYEVGDTDHFNGTPLWQVYYSATGSDPDKYPARMPVNGNKEYWEPTLWQWSGGGDYAYYHKEFGPIPGAGSSGIVDVNRLYGGEEVLNKLAAHDGDDSGCPNPEPPPSIVYPAPPPQDIDLYQLRGTTSEFTDRVQALLLSHGYGPDGLIGSDGFPDGQSGSKTEGYLTDFKRQHGLPNNTIVDWQTWWMLLLSTSN